MGSWRGLQSAESEILAGNLSAQRLDAACAGRVLKDVRHSRIWNRRQFVGCRQLRKAGFKMFLIVCVNLSKLNSEAFAGLVSNTTYNAAQCGKVSSRMCNLQS